MTWEYTRSASGTVEQDADQSPRRNELPVSGCTRVEAAPQPRRRGWRPRNLPRARWTARAIGQRSGPADLTVRLNQIGQITVHGATVAVADDSGAGARELTIAGELATDDIVQLLVQTGAFDTEARAGSSPPHSATRSPRCRRGSRFSHRDRERGAGRGTARSSRSRPRVAPWRSLDR